MHISGEGEGNPTQLGQLGVNIRPPKDFKLIPGTADFF